MPDSLETAETSGLQAGRSGSNSSLTMTRPKTLRPDMETSQRCPSVMIPMELPDRRWFMDPLSWAAAFLICALAVAFLRSMLRLRVEAAFGLSLCLNQEQVLGRCHENVYEFSSVVGANRIREDMVTLELAMKIGRDIDLGHLSPALYGHVNPYGILARFSGPSRGRFRHGYNLYLLAMTGQSFPRPKPRRTGAS